MSDLWSHSHEWDKGYAKGHKDGYKQGMADERKNVLDEVYAIALNETHDTLIEWLQNNIQD